MAETSQIPMTEDQHRLASLVLHYVSSEEAQREYGASYDPDKWWEPLDDGDGCATAGCVAGWAVQLADGDLPVTRRDWAARPDADCDPAGRAAELLGLPAPSWNSKGREPRLFHLLADGDAVRVLADCVARKAWTWEATGVKRWHTEGSRDG